MNEVAKDIEQKSYMIALNSRAKVNNDLYSNAEMREMREYVANNWSFVPQELKDIWGTPVSVREGTPINLPESLEKKAIKAVQDHMESLLKKQEHPAVSEKEAKTSTPKEIEKKYAKR